MAVLGPNVRKIIEISSAPLSEKTASLNANVRSISDPLFEELQLLLATKNGFFAFESALHFLPAETSLLSIGIEEWNSSPGWRDVYGELAEDCLFFAEDIFGGQFCITGGRILTFDPETGEKRAVGCSLDDWASAILGDFTVLTGHPIAHAWQQANGLIPEGMRLVPRVPFACGGEFSLANLILIESTRGMRIRGALARQIKDLPDGAQIVFEIGE